MKKALIFTILFALSAGLAAAQNPVRKVLYTLAYGETILYGEYMVDFGSPNKNYVATIINKADAHDWYGSRESGGTPGHIYHQWDYATIPYQIVLNGERRTLTDSKANTWMEWNQKNKEYYPRSHVSRPEKTISTSKWDDIAHVWGVSGAYYIRFHGLIYGPYEGQPLVDDFWDAFTVFNDGDWWFVKDGKEAPLAEQGFASMPLNYSEPRKYVSVKGCEYKYDQKLTDGKWVYILTVNGKEFNVDFEPYNDLVMSANGKHWILTSYRREKFYYVDGVKKEFADADTETTGRGYIGNGGYYIVRTNKGFVVNGTEKRVPVEDITGGYGNYPCATVYGFAYRDGDKNYVFNGGEFVQTFWKPAENRYYPYNTQGTVTLVSDDRRHMMVYGWELPHVTIDGKTMGSAPAITAEWNKATRSFYWNALEGHELVTYEYKP